MDAGLLLQYAVIAVAVIASVAFVVRRQFPAGVRRAQVVHELDRQWLIEAKPLPHLLHLFGRSILPRSQNRRVDGDHARQQKYDREQSHERRHEPKQSVRHH